LKSSRKCRMRWMIVSSRSTANRFMEAKKRKRV
jgi:hypothetical protein